MQRERELMCRTREEIIANNPDLQDLQFSIEALEEKVKNGENGFVKLQLHQARVDLTSAIQQIQMDEDMNSRLTIAEEEREEIKENLKEAIDTNKQVLEETNKKLVDHLQDCEENPRLTIDFISNPAKYVDNGWKFLGALIAGISTLFFFLSTLYHALMYTTGFDKILEKALQSFF